MLPQNRFQRKFNNPATNFQHLQNDQNNSTIRQVSEVIGDTKPCDEVMRSMLKRIEWRDQ